MTVLGFPTSVRERVRRRSRNRCEIHGLPADSFQDHHRRPRGMGGSSDLVVNSAANALRLCVSCHAMVEADRARALHNGWLVSSYADPRDVPVLLAGGLARLRVDGTIDWLGAGEGGGPGGVEGDAGPAGVGESGQADVGGDHR